MKSKNITKYICAISVVFILLSVSCKSSKAGQSESDSSSKESTLVHSRIDSLFQRATGKESKEIVGRMAERYAPWNTVMISAQLQMEGLPLSPSLKIFMKKGECMTISVRAPFLGEVGRLEFANDTILAVNKMKNVYTMADISQLMGGIEFTLSDLQDVLLARAFAIGEGTISQYEKSKHTLYYAENGEYFFPPMPQSDNMLYGFIIDGEGVISDFMLRDYIGGFELNCLYQNKKKSYDIVMAFQYVDVQMQVVLSDVMCQWEAQPMNPVKLTSKMREVGIKEFLRF